MNVSHPSFQHCREQVTSPGLLPSLGCCRFVGNTGTSMMRLSKINVTNFISNSSLFSSCITSFPMSLGPKFIEWVLNYLLLLIGMFPVVPMFCGLVGRWSLGRMCHCGKVVSDRDASGNDALHSCWDSSWSHTDHPRGIPGRGDTERQVCHSRAHLTPITPPALWRKHCKEIPLPSWSHIWFSF